MPAVSKIRGLTEADLGFAGEVREIAGWNQLPADWRRFLRLEPEGCFLAEVDGNPAGTATTTCFGGALAWIGMVLVHPDFRRRGIGTELLEHCIRHLREGRSIPSVKLDATPEGRPLYEKLGFRAEWGLRRWLSKSRHSGGDGNPNAPTLPLSPATLAFDRGIFGADRSELLRSLAEGAMLGTDRGESGFGLCRDGAKAVYLGPIAAADRETGESIARDVIGRIPADRWIFWDIPDDNRPAVALAETLGFEPVRVLTRMWLGENSTPGDPRRMWALADPALG